MSITQAEIDRRFDYHAPDAVKREQHDKVRATIKGVVQELVGMTTQSREQSLMLTALEEAQSWAHADIARNL